MKPGGHIVFGLVAAAPSMDLGLILLAGGESVPIDSDYLLAAVGYPVAGRLAHSIFFALLAAGILAYLAKRGERSGAAVFLVTLSSVVAHLGYDIFAGNRFFYILAPTSFKGYELQDWGWPFLLGVALLLCVPVGVARKSLHSSR